MMLTGSRTAGSPFSPFRARMEAWGKQICNPKQSPVNIQREQANRPRCSGSSWALYTHLHYNPWVVM